MTEYFTLANFSALDPSTTVLLLEVTSSATGAPVVQSTNVVALGPPKQWRLPNATVTIDSVTPDPSTGGATVVVSSDQTALYVTLTTLATGRFSENAFLLLPREGGGGLGAGAAAGGGQQQQQQQEHSGGSGSSGGGKTLTFLPFEGQVVDMELLRSSLRADHIGLYVA